MASLQISALPEDTTREAAWAQIEVYRRMAPEQRLLQTLRLSDSMREYASAGVRDQHPEFSDEQVRLTVIRMWLGEDLFRQAFPDANLPK